MLKLRLNRKAMIEDWIPLIIFIIVMAFIIVFFMSYRSGQKVKLENEFEKNKIEIEAYQALNNYLRLYSDKIILTISEEYEEDKLEEETINFFNEYYKKWWIRISFGNKALNYYTKEKPTNRFVPTEIPYFNNNIEAFFFYE